MEHYFEKECRTYLEQQGKRGKLHGWYSRFENYHVENSALGRSIELDIVAANEKSLLIGECKFSKKKRTTKDYEKILEDISVPPFNAYKKVEIYLFGASGFDPKLRQTKDSSLHLIDLSTMFSRN